MNSNETDSFQSEPIAIIGAGCRFPGGVKNPNEFWELLKEGKDGIIDIPSDRWNVDEFYDPNPDVPGKMYVRAGGFITQKIKEFDAAFFGISPREAGFIDPQQRILMEVAWEALEDAGLQVNQLAGSNTGVYIGGFMLDNLLTQFSPLNREFIGSHSAIGSTLTILANRLSYIFDLCGPSIALDTACSSSLVAMHLACQSIWRGECELALFGGVNIMHRPENLIAMCKGGFLSPDGRCKSFDIRADGYGRGEGAGVVVLKPYSAALRDGDDIYGLVRGTGSNQDGRTDGITVPNASSQEALIRKVCAEANIDPHQIRYVEAHGTGTSLGDPLEAKAIGAALGQNRDADSACVVGSVKANIGHLEAASGVAGVIKLALCLKHQAIPPLANLTQANPKIPFDELHLRLPRVLESMPQGTGSVCVAINSFGYGGSNAHVILEEYVAEPNSNNVVSESNLSPQYLLPLSARSKSALYDLSRCYHEQLMDNDSSVQDMCYSATLRRSHHDFRLALVADTRENMLLLLQNIINDETGPGITTGSCSQKEQKPVFVLTGMGPQWWGMGRELFASEAVFRSTAQECDVIFKQLSGWSILDEMLADESVSRITETQIAQPANFVLQVSLVALWRSWGIEPAAVVGHSVGEVAAAYIAGVLSLADALRVSYHRSRIQKKAAGIGTMLAVGLSATEVENYLPQFQGLVSLAAANSPSSVTLAGDHNILQQFAHQMQEKEIFHRFLNVEVAYHSHTMEPLEAEMLEALAGLTIRPATIPLYSTVTGDLADAQAYDTDYWYQNIRQPVLFEKSVNALIRDEYRLFLEVGPHPVLSTSINECLITQGVSGTVLTSLRRNKPEKPTLFEALAGLYCSGSLIDWSRYYASGGSYVKLPTYPWQREEHWNEGEVALWDRTGMAEHSLLGNRTDGPGFAWKNTLNSNKQPYIQHHQVEDLIILPGAAYVELGLAIHKEVIGQPSMCLENLIFSQALIVANSSQPHLHVTYNELNRKYNVFSREREGSDWIEHAQGFLSYMPLATPELYQLERVQERCTYLVGHDTHYTDMHARGLQYGPYFQGVKAMWLNSKGSEALAQIEIPTQLGPRQNDNLLPPYLLDASFQTLLACLTMHKDQNVYVPVNIRQVRLYGALPDNFWCHAELYYHQVGTLEGNITLCSQDGQVLAEIFGVKAQALSQKSSDEMAGLDQWLYQFEWEPAAEVSTAKDGGSWLLLGSQELDTDALANELYARNADKVIIARSGQAFAQVGLTEYVLRPDLKEDMQRLLEEVNVSSLRGVVHLWSLDTGKSVDNIGTENVISAMNLVQSLTEREDAKAVQLFFVTEQAQVVTPQQAEISLAQAALLGFVRVAINEFQTLPLRVIDIEPGIELIKPLVQEILTDSREEEIALRVSGRYQHRLTHRCSADFEAADKQQRQRPGEHQVEVAISQVVLANDDSDRKNSLIGAQAFGVVASVGAGVKNIHVNAQVMFPLSAEPSAFTLVPEQQLLACSPSDGTQADALQLNNFITAYYTLHDVANLKQGERILIHNASDKLGLASIQIARWLGASLYVTAETEAQRAYLRSLGLTYVFNTGSIEFADKIEALTKGQGLDVVINCPAGEMAIKTHRLLNSFGRFISNKRQVYGAVGSELLLKENQSIISLDMMQVIRKYPELYIRLRSEVSALVASSALQPLAVQRITFSELHEYQEEGHSENHFGLSVIDFGDAISRITLSNAVPGRFDANATYLITGGFGGFGLLIANWLMEKGVRHLALVGRSGASTADAKLAVQELRTSGVNVYTAAADISCDADIQQLLQSIAKNMPPLKGIFHAAAVLDDAAINALSPEKIHRVMQPKAMGAWLLSQHTTKLPLDYFVLFSSIGSLVGNPGQAAYVSANAYLDALAHYRHQQGLSVTAINWGALGEVGMAARQKNVEDYLSRTGFGLFTPDQVLAVLDKILEWKPVNIGAAIMDWHKFNISYPNWAQAPRNIKIFADIERNDKIVSTIGPLQTLYQLDFAQRKESIEDSLFGLISTTLRVSRNKIDAASSLLSMGMDSMMGIELQGAIEKSIGIKISTLELMKGNSISALIIQLSDLVGKYVTPTEMVIAEDNPAEHKYSIKNPFSEDIQDLDIILSELSEEEIDQFIEKLLHSGVEV